MQIRYPRPAYESPSSAPVLIDILQGQDEEPVPPHVLFADLSDVEDDTDLRPHTINRFVRQLSRNHVHLYISRWG